MDFPRRNSSVLLTTRLTVRWQFLGTTCGIYERLFDHSTILLVLLILLNLFTYNSIVMVMAVQYHFARYFIYKKGVKVKAMKSINEAKFHLGFFFNYWSGDKKFDLHICKFKYKVSAILFFNLIMSTSTTFDQICKCAKLMFGDVFAAGGNVQLPSSRRCKCDSKFVAKIKFA